MQFKAPSLIAHRIRPSDEPVQTTWSESATMESTDLGWPGILSRYRAHDPTCARQMRIYPAAPNLVNKQVAVLRAAHNGLSVQNQIQRQQLVLKVVGLLELVVAKVHGAHAAVAAALG